MHIISPLTINAGTHFTYPQRDGELSNPQPGWVGNGYWTWDLLHEGPLLYELSYLIEFLTKYLIWFLIPNSPPYVIEVGFQVWPPYKRLGTLYTHAYTNFSCFFFYWHLADLEISWETIRTYHFMQVLCHMGTCHGGISIDKMKLRVKSLLVINMMNYCYKCNQLHQKTGLKKYFEIKLGSWILVS